ncbi:MAG: hypothetical protein NTW17_01430 [Candidatus Pacearchaeota archaeon]|nr:hypothetical protein [Candidatus Pacearchaeota archaeon]
MKKKLAIPLLAILAIGLAAATVVATIYIVNSLTLTVGVAEPFTVQYAVIGDAGNWDGVTTCNSYTGDWFTSDSQSIPTGNMYAGEGRGVCVKITNAGEASIPYTITNTVTGSDGNPNSACTSAFSKPTITGTATALTETRNGVGIIISPSAPPVNDCLVTINVARGTA